MQEQLSKEEIAFLEQMVLSYSDVLMRSAYRFFGYRSDMYSAAEDAVQETFMKAGREVKNLMTHPNPRAWLFTSLRYSMLNIKRKSHYRMEELHADVNLIHQVSRQRMLEDIERWETQVELHEVIQCVERILTDDEKTTFQDYFVKGKALKEAALDENVSCDTVRGRISRIRKKIKIILANLCFFLFCLFLY